MLAKSNFKLTFKSSLITPGKFIISPRQITLGSSNKFLIVSTSILAPLVSKLVAGTQEGAEK